MRQVILFIATSLDGFIARPDGGIDWLFTDRDYGYAAFYEGVDAVILGRKTYEQVLTFGEFPYSGKECYVFTRTPVKGRDDRVVFVDQDPAVLIGRLRERPGRNIWLVGGAALAREFAVRDLIDEYIISVHPLILGSGIPLCKEPYPPARLTLVDCTTFPSGLVQLTYSRLRS